jgi:type IV pilus assembly protein PilB
LSLTGKENDMSAPINLVKDLLSHEDFNRALRYEEEGSDPYDFILTEKILAPATLLPVLSRFWKIPFLELEFYHPQKSALGRVNEDVARRFNVLPLFQLEDSLYVATWEPDNLATLDYLRQLTGFTIEAVLAARTDLEEAINRHFLSSEQVAQAMGSFAAREKGDDLSGIDELRIEDSEAPAIKLVNYIISQAINLGASDIHLEPYPGKAKLRYRVDGVLHEFPPPPHHLYRSLVARIKIISGMDVAEKRLPQDGRTAFVSDDKKYDLRVSVIPNMNDEGVVIRVLDTQSKGQELVDLGFSKEMMERYSRFVRMPYGIILVTGPTGSGKSTTLYATLKEIYSPRKKIITIEDPVEYQLEGITQIQVNPVIGYTFASGLRSILRHDPDIIMLGEIRDLESAEIAIRSSLTGHLVLSTLHTNDAPTAVIRLIDMGIPAYLVLASLNGVLAQRLIRKLCPKCRRQATYVPGRLAFLGIDPIPPEASFFEPVGCQACNNLGYRGREAIMEMLEINTEIRHIPQETLSLEKIKELARLHGYTTLKESLAAKLMSGITSLEEVASLTSIEY